MLLGSPDEGLAPALQEIQNSSFVPVMVASDEEGGEVRTPAFADASFLCCTCTWHFAAPFSHR